MTQAPRSIFSLWHPGSTEDSAAREIWMAAYGSDYPEDAEPMSFVTFTDLEWIARILSVTAGSVVADLGCGRGGPGLWVAQRFGCRLVGIDIGEEAIADASRRVSHGEMEGLATFRVGTFAATGLGDAAMDALISFDALFFAPSRLAAFREAARILEPGGVFAFTTFEFQRPSLALSVDAIDDYRPYLEVSGFQVEQYEEADNWAPRMKMVLEGIIRRASELRSQIGEEVTTRLVRWATVRNRELTDSRRIIVSARRLG